MGSKDYVEIEGSAGTCGGRALFNRYCGTKLGWDGASEVDSPICDCTAPFRVAITTDAVGVAAIPAVGATPAVPSPTDDLVTDMGFRGVCLNFSQKAGLDFGITMQIKPRNISGLILAIQGRKDYLILQMVDGTMTFQVDNGRGPITAIFKPESPFQFCDGNWHEVHAVKAKNVVTLSVDNIFAQPGIGVPGVSSTDTNHGLFIGGHPRADRLTGLQTS